MAVAPQGGQFLPGAQAGQATVEAAVLLPTLMLALALLLQPVCLSYTRMLMRSAAAETARVALTDYDGSLDDCTAFAKRRLEAVPNVPLFHAGGQDDWDVSIDNGGEQVSVEIVGHAHPLPLLGVVLGVFGESDGQGIVLRENVTERLRPSWLGGSYETWQTIWG